MIQRNWLHTIGVGAILALTANGAIAQRTSTFTGGRIIPPSGTNRNKNNGGLFNYGIGYNYGSANGSIAAGNGFTSGNYLSNSNVILGSGGAQIVNGSGTIVSGGTTLSGFGASYGSYGYGYGYPATPGYSGDYGYGFNPDALNGYGDGSNANSNGNPNGDGTANGNGGYGYGNDGGVPLAQTVSGSLLTRREGNGRIRLTWSGDTSMVSRVYLALLDRSKQAVSQKLITTPPASARFVLSPRARYLGVIVDYIDGTRSTVINPLQ